MGPLLATVTTQMRGPRYRFSDAVRASTRALALRMIHSGNVAVSSQELAQAIERTEDLRAKLVAGGYGTQFTAEDLYPLYEGAVSRATNVAPARTASPSKKWPWVLAAAVIVAVVAVALLLLA